MIEVAVAIIALVVAWVLRTAFYDKAEVFKTEINLSTAEDIVNLQPDIKALDEKVDEIIEKNGGIWYDMDTIYKKMNR